MADGDKGGKPKPIKTGPVIKRSGSGRPKPTLGKGKSSQG